MPIKYISGKAVITQLTSRRKVLTTDWIPSIGSYIYDVIKDINCPLISAHYKQTMPVINGVCSYPDDYERIEYITFNNAYVRSTNFGLSKIPQDVDIPLHLNLSCKLVSTGIKFDNILDQMIDGFRAYTVMSDISIWKDDPGYAELNDKFNIAMRLFVENFSELYD